jgi:hypothetical protein
VSDFDEPLRDGRAHFADPGDADLHRTGSYELPRTATSFGSRRDDKGLGTCEIALLRPMRRSRLKADGTAV